MCGYQGHEARLRELGGVHHGGGRYVNHRLILRFLAHRRHIHVAVLALMIVSALKTCQLLPGVSLLWIIVNWAEQTVGTHRTSCM